MSLKVVDGRVFVQATVQTIQTADGKSITVAVLPPEMLNQKVVSQPSSVQYSLPSLQSNCAVTTKENRPLLPKSSYSYVQNSPNFTPSNPISSSVFFPPPATTVSMALRDSSPLSLDVSQSQAVPADPCPLSELLANTYQDWTTDPCPVLEPNIAEPVSNRPIRDNKPIAMTNNHTNTIRLSLNDEEMTALGQFTGKINDLTIALNQSDVSWDVRKKIPAILQLLEEKRNELLMNIYQQRLTEQSNTIEYVNQTPSSSRVCPAPSQEYLEERRKINSASCLQNRLECDLSAVSNPCIDPFIDRSDAYDRLIPYHLLDEPQPSTNLLARVDSLCEEIFNEQAQKTSTLHAKFQDILFQESMIDSNSSDRLLICRLLHEDESSSLIQDKSLAANDLKSFLSNSPFLDQIRSEYIQNESPQISPVPLDAPEPGVEIVENNNLIVDEEVEDDVNIVQEHAQGTLNIVEEKTESTFKIKDEIVEEHFKSPELKVPPLKVKLKRKSDCWRPWSPPQKLPQKHESVEQNDDNFCIRKIKIRVKRKKMPVLVLKRVKEEVVDGLEEEEGEDNNWVKLRIKDEFELVPSPGVSSESDEFS